jgi:3D (Asp-Asp-Asp) domain-containing protein
MQRIIISRSLWKKLLVTLVASVGFVLLYEATVFDSREAAAGATASGTAAAPGASLRFSATAYCKGTTTASGAAVRTGIAAADPAILPVGSVVNVTTEEPKYNGIYTIMDTGPKIQGRILDVYMWSCHEALAFGRKPIDVTVLRLGWNPNASTPSLIDRLFRRREAARSAASAAAAGGAPPIAADAVAAAAVTEQPATIPVVPTAAEATPGSAPDVTPAAAARTDMPSAAAPTP